MWNRAENQIELVLIRHGATRANEERRYLGALVQDINWKRWFYGHFHEHNYWGMADKIATGLGIMELLEIPEKEGDE